MGRMGLNGRNSNEREVTPIIKEKRKTVKMARKIRSFIYIKTINPIRERRIKNTKKGAKILLQPTWSTWNKT